MPIDQIKIKDFWDAQAKKAQKLSLNGVANLEENTDLLEMKVTLESNKIMKKIRLDKNISSVLDLGAGAGQWSFRFAELAKNIVAVEYSESMLELAINEGKKKDIQNIKFVHCAAQEYSSEEQYDLIWISGLLIYLSDEDCECLINNCAAMLKNNGTLLLRDGTGIQGRHEINNNYSEDLHAYYSAVYRTPEEYLSLFKRYGLNILNHEDMFEQDSPLNKWNETRLRVYEFNKQ